MSNKILCIDMDEVVADLKTVCVDFYNRDYPESKKSVDDFDSWHGNWHLLKDYFIQEGIYATLPVIENSQEVLKELSTKHDVFFVTASPTPQATFEKMNWVNEHFPFIGSKKMIATAYKEIIRGDLLFDDSPDFLPKFNGIRVLMDSSHNWKLGENEYEHRVHNWLEFGDVMEKIEKGWTM